jgi:hypothetical protein
MVVILFGVLDLGRVYFAMITLASAAREGARYLTLHPSDISNDLGAFHDTDVIVHTEANNSGVQVSSTTITCQNIDDEPSACDGGYSAIVTLTSDFHLLLGWILPSPITLVRSAEMVVP